MSLSENTRLELMRITLRFTTDNFKIAQNGLETAHGVSECYRVLAEALSHDERSNLSEANRCPFNSIFRNCEGAISLKAAIDQISRILKESEAGHFWIFLSSQMSEVHNYIHSFINRYTHSSSPIDSKKTAPDSTSEAAEKSVAQPAFELSVEELLKIIDGPVSRALAERALNELKRRAGEREASS